MIVRATLAATSRQSFQELWHKPSFNTELKYSKMERDLVWLNVSSLNLGLISLPEDVAAMTEDQGAYGSFGGAGYLVINRTISATVSEYSRWLDMDRAVAVSKWKEGGVWISRYSHIITILRVH